ncbi:hypothetical protein [Carboxylicivirga taeanensis]|uniref:hypothetical protein n=1 Tax=Carboxylicivirga taeanensis TaxID=1416875 RepID=UPI003F6DCF9F
MKLEVPITNDIYNELVLQAEEFNAPIWVMAHAVLKGWAEERIEDRRLCAVVDEFREALDRGDYSDE